MRINIPTLCWLALLGFASPVAADVAPWPRSRLDITLHFAAVEAYPQYDFYLKYGLGPGNPYASLRLTPVPPDGVIHLADQRGGARLTSVYLLAVPHGQPAPQVPSGASASWLEQVPEGALQSPPLMADGALLGTGLGGAEVNYRIGLVDGQLQAQWLDTKYASRGLWGLGAVAALGVGAVGAVAVVLVRRRRRPAQEA